MIHNNNIDLFKVKQNVEEALYSKLLNMAQNSGRCEMHATGFVSLHEALVKVEKLIADKAVTDEMNAPKSKTKTQ